jgi:hypothetical protein
MFRRTSLVCYQGKQPWPAAGISLENRECWPRPPGLVGLNPRLPAGPTPHLTRFAEESVQFERSYVCCPETGPSQASLITGHFPFACGVTRDGMPLPPDQVTVAQRLKEAGYQTALIGDWRLGAPQKRAETNLALEFIKQNRHNPFFLLLAWTRAEATVVDDNAGRVLAVIDSLMDRARWSLRCAFPGCFAIRALNPDGSAVSSPRTSM